MNSESLRIADQLRRAYTRDAWLVLHVQLYAHIALEATQGVPMPKLYGTEKDWPTAADTSAAAWSDATAHLFGTAEQLAHAIEGFADARLQEIVPGRRYDFYRLFHGIVQHVCTMADRSPC